MDLLFVVMLIFTAYRFLHLTYCQPCDENVEWHMNIDYKNWTGRIECFGPQVDCSDKNLQNSDCCTMGMKVIRI